MELRRNIVFLLIVLTACGQEKSTPFSQEIYSSDKSNIKAANLVSPVIVNDWLQQSPTKYIVVQVSKEKTFYKSHIPNALNIWRPDYTSDISEPISGLLPSREKLQFLLQSLGYSKDKILLLYDAKANVDALRLAWVLSLYGFENYKIINGGLRYWASLGLPTTTGAARVVTPSEYHLSDTYDASILAEFQDVVEAIQDTQTLLIDTREPFEYEGLPYIQQGVVLPYKKGAYGRGRIPTAIHLNWSKLADLEGDHRIKTEKDLRYDLDSLRITPDKRIILYCQTGSRTSHTFYVLKHILDYQNVQNYDGSWVEWSYKHSLDSTLPVIHCDGSVFAAAKDSLIANQIYNE